MTNFDNVAERKAEEEWRAWLGDVKGALDELIGMVHRKRGGGEFEEIVRYYGGSFNICIQISFDDDGPDAILRLAKAGVTAFRDEKVRNEVEVMNFLRQNTTIPVPRVVDWGLTADSPQDLGPYIIMDYVEGVHLSDLLQKPSENAEAPIVLNPDVDNEMLDIVYQQIAGFMLQLYQFEFSTVGAIALDPDESKTWSATRRPLTYNMNELVTCADYPASLFSSEPFQSTKKYMEALADQHLNHLRTQRNLADNVDDAERRYVARHLFAQLAVSRYTTDRNHNTGPFKLFCDDFRPSNILVDETTLQITAVLDFEFTNAMPTQFSEEPPWWLLLRGPARRLDAGETIEELIKSYQPRLEQFLRALEHEEVRRCIFQDQTQCLSSLMRNSWKSGNFWFNLAARNSFDMDAVFYAYLDGADFGGNAGPHLLSEELQRELKPFVEMKMDQKALHDLEFQSLLSSQSVSWSHT